MTKKDYAATIQNTGTQVVPAPARKSPPKKGTVKQGSDPAGGRKK